MEELELGERRKRLKEATSREEVVSGEKKEERREEEGSMTLTREEKKLNFWLSQTGSEPPILGLFSAFNSSLRDFPPTPLLLPIPVPVPPPVPATRTHTHVRMLSGAAVVGIEGGLDHTSSHRPWRRPQK